MEENRLRMLRNTRPRRITGYKTRNYEEVVEN
jgi:hypothetical protein